MNAEPSDNTVEKITVFNAETGTDEEVPKVQKTEREWEDMLAPDEFVITRQKGTEPAFTGQYWDNKDAGIYKCVCCGNDLFTSEAKFESGTGWPSFTQPVDERNVIYEADNSFLMQRIEVLCSRCEAHLGHVFDDGPMPTGKRFCMNSASLKFSS